MNVDEVLYKLEAAIREEILEDGPDSDKYWEDVNRVAQRTMDELVVMLAVWKHPETGHRTPLICFFPDGADGNPDHKSVSFETLLAEYSRSDLLPDGDFSLWLDELERLLKVHGRR